MKYFTEEICGALKSNTSTDKKNIPKLYGTACGLYAQELRRLEKKLPKKFMKLYRETGYLEDFHVPYLNLVWDEGAAGEKHKKSACRIIFSSAGGVWRIDLKGILKSEIGFLTHVSPFVHDEYLYGELLYLEEKKFSWEMHFESGTNYKFTFRHLRCKELKGRAARAFSRFQ